MRLLNVYTLEFREFFNHDIPPYAILSHRWSQDEVTYQDFRKHRRQHAVGYRKILNFCHVIRGWFEQYPAQERPRDGQDLSVQWVWIDTCCIDKKNSTELIEAVNSMFDWYKNAVVCCVHLYDVHDDNELADSNWFSRGWTLQELLAPDVLVFFDRQWTAIGHIVKKYKLISDRAPQQRPDRAPELVRALRRSRDRGIEKDIANVTGIPEDALVHVGSLSDWTIAQRMSWAARRQTTRVEDEAYCLIGIFQVNMPLLYGEGRRAFLRLQQEIIKQSTDQSIFAWKSQPSTNEGGVPELIAPMLARSVSQFWSCRNIERFEPRRPKPYTITNSGLEMSTDLYVPEKKSPSYGTYLLPLNCCESFGMAQDEDCRVQVMIPLILDTSPTLSLQNLTRLQTSEVETFFRVYREDEELGVGTRRRPTRTLYYIDNNIETWLQDR